MLALSNHLNFSLGRPLLNRTRLHSCMERQKKTGHDWRHRSAVANDRVTQSPLPPPHLSRLAFPQRLHQRLASDDGNVRTGTSLRLVSQRFKILRPQQGGWGDNGG